MILKSIVNKNNSNNRRDEEINRPISDSMNENVLLINRNSGKDQTINRTKSKNISSSNPSSNRSSSSAVLENEVDGIQNYFQPDSESYKRIIIDIYQSLYDFQRNRSDGQQIRLMDCINRWYDPNSVFENPFTRASGSQSIINHFSLMSIIPGKIWSELGDICESDDYDGNRVIIFTHTLHFNLLESNESSSDANSTLATPQNDSSLPQTPYLSSIQSQIGMMNPTISTYFNLHSYSSFGTTTHNSISHNDPHHQNHHHHYHNNPPTHPFRVRQAGSETKWPISWLISHLNPFNIFKNVSNFNLKLLTKLHLNEQSRIVYHEDVWGIKELLEFLSPRIFNQALCLQRRFIGLIGDLLSERLVQMNSGQNNQSGNHHYHHSINDRFTSLSKPISIGNDDGRKILRSNNPHERSIRPNNNDEDEEVNRSEEEDDDDDHHDLMEDGINRRRALKKTKKPKVINKGGRGMMILKDPIKLEERTKDEEEEEEGEDGSEGGGGSSEDENENFGTSSSSSIISREEEREEEGDGEEKDLRTFHPSRNLSCSVKRQVGSKSNKNKVKKRNRKGSRINQ